MVLHIDEAGIDNRLYREYGRAPIGKKIYADIPGRKRERISIIGGWIGKRFIAPMTFKGGCIALLTIVRTGGENIFIAVVSQEASIVLL